MTPLHVTPLQKIGLFVALKILVIAAVVFAFLKYKNLI